MNLKNLPDYDPPHDKLGTKESEYDLNWSQGLRKYKTSEHDPAWVYSYIVDENGLPFASIIYDRFPKAFIHLLILPMNIKSEKPSEFTKKDIPQLSRIHDLAYKISNGFQLKYNMPEFLIGYHSIPSMSDLHLHIVSNDLVSPFMKRKEHYNSFTTDYLIPPHRVINDLFDYGKVQILPRNKLKDGLRKHPLICIHCHRNIKTFKELKNHLNSHYTGSTC